MSDTVLDVYLQLMCSFLGFRGRVVGDWGLGTEIYEEIKGAEHIPIEVIPHANDNGAIEFQLGIGLRY
jgi:hypothetical protein